jgi:hypothetical protein
MSVKESWVVSVPSKTVGHRVVQPVNVCESLARPELRVITLMLVLFPSLILHHWIGNLIRVSSG